MKMKPVVITTSWPPTVNHYWGQRRFGKRRFVTARGLEYREEVRRETVAGDALMAFADGDLLEVRIAFWPPDDHRLHDIDGPIKPIYDALQEAGMFPNDNQIVCGVQLKLPPDTEEGSALIMVGLYSIKTPWRTGSASTSRWQKSGTI